MRERGSNGHTFKRNVCKCCGSRKYTHWLCPCVIKRFRGPTADVAGTYLNAPCAEKVYTILGEELGDYAGRKAIIVMALYGLKSAGCSWRSFYARILREESGLFRAAQTWISGTGQQGKRMEVVNTNIFLCIQMILFPLRRILDDEVERKIRMSAT